MPSYVFTTQTYLTAMEGKIGQLHFNLREKIDSNGSFGKTYKGTLNETADVAVKLVSKEEFDVDLEAIRQVNNHQHILSVYCSEEDILFMYIAVHRTLGTLKDLALREYAVHAVGDWQKVLYQLTSGLNHLHTKQVIHGHLKPKNILVSCPDGEVPPMIKLANFGIVKRTSSRNGNPVSLWKLGGSKSWLPAEAYVKTQFTIEMDVYALGLLFGYCLNNGSHPFGEDKDERIIRIKKSEPMTLTLNQLRNVNDPEKVFQLINWMLSPEPSMRPTSTRVLMDDFFSSSKTRDLELEEVPTTSRKMKQEVIDDDEISIIAEYFPQSKKAKREEPIRDSFLCNSISKRNSPGSEPTAMPGTNETPEPSHWNFYSPLRASEAEASHLNQVENMDQKCSTLQNDDAGTYTENNDDEYMSRSMFRTAEAYTNYVRKRIERGMRVRCCESVESIDLFFGQSGTVVAINRKIEFNIKIKWDGVPEPNWVKYQNVEMLADATDETSDSESLAASDLLLNESNNEDTNIEKPVRIESIVDEFSRSADHSSTQAEDLNEGEEDQEIISQDDDNSTDDHKLEKELIQLCKMSRYWKKRSFDRFRSLVLDPNVNINYTDDEGLTVLLLLCWKPQHSILLNCIEILIQRDDLDLSVLDDGEWNALPTVCRWYRGPNLPEIVALFFERGIDPNTCDRGGDNALIVACANVQNENLFEVVQLLIQHNIEINAKNSKNWNALHALFFNYKGQNVMRIAQLLLDAGIEVEVKTQDGWNALLAMTQNHLNHPDFFSILAKFLANGADASAKDQHGWNILHSICSYFKGNNIVQIIRHLVRHGLDINAKDLDDWNALIFTSRSSKQGRRFIEITRVLIELGIDLNTKEKDGFTALHYLCKEVTKRNNLESIRFLLEETNINFSLKDNKGRKPVDLLRKLSKTKRISLGLQKFTHVIQLLERL